MDTLHRDSKTELLCKYSTITHSSQGFFNPPWVHIYQFCNVCYKINSYLKIFHSTLKLSDFYGTYCTLASNRPLGITGTWLFKQLLVCLSASAPRQASSMLSPRSCWHTPRHAGPEGQHCAPFPQKQSQYSYIKKDIQLQIYFSWNSIFRDSAFSF